jgi:hypothetical protein
MDTVEVIKALKSQIPGREVYPETWVFESREQAFIDEISYPVRIRVEYAPRDIAQMRTSTYYQLVAGSSPDSFSFYVLSRHMWWYMKDYAIHTSCTIEYTLDRALHHPRGIISLVRMNTYLHHGVDGILPEPE